jgi:magnesium-transporting ATPase (P-type)
MTEYDDYVQSTVNEVYQKLKTGPEGLESEEIIRRLKEHGPNTIPLTKKLSLTSRTILQLKNAFNLLLLLATTLSLFSGYAYRDTGSIQMGWAIAAVVAINVAFSIFQEYRAEQAVQSIAKMIPTKAKALRGGTQVEVEVSEIVPGDIIILEEGDRVPADVRLIKAFEISVNNSILTGESDPQRRFRHDCEHNLRIPEPNVRWSYRGIRIRKRRRNIHRKRYAIRTHSSALRRI